MRKLFCLLITFTSNYSISQTIFQGNTLEVVKWDLEWFGHPSNEPDDEELQMNNSLEIIDQISRPDVIVFEEIAIRPQFEEFAYRADCSFFLSPSADSYQKK